VDRHLLKSRTVVTRLEDHPNLPEILGVLAQLAHVADGDLPQLASGWVNSPALAVARDKALAPDSPLVVEVLAAFDAVSALFAEDVLGEAPYLTVEPAVAVRALKAVRDAIAAAYAKPVLSRSQHAALMRPWWSVYQRPTVEEPDLGARSEQVKGLLGMLPRMAGRCHDDTGQALFDALVDRSFIAESERAEAVESAFQAAVVTGRRRMWALVRRSGADGLSRPCPECRTPAGDDDGESRRVVELCLDAACALLVTDALPDSFTDLITIPVTSLLPTQRVADPSS
jgi:hypothetical protein